MPFTALYARVSTDNQSSGLESQIRALQDYCSANNITDFKIYSDEGISGAKESRPALNEMIKAVESGEVTCVVVYSFNRFARSTRQLLNALERFNEKNVAFVSLSERIDTNSPIGKAFFTIIAALGQLEREQISQRVRNGLKNAKAKGKRIGRARTRNTELIKLLITQGATYREIAKLAKCSHWVIREVRKEMQSSETVQPVSAEQKQAV